MYTNTALKHYRKSPVHRTQKCGSHAAQLIILSHGGCRREGISGAWGPRDGWSGVHSAVWKRLVRSSLLSNLFSPAAKEPISSSFSFQISQHAMALRLRTVYLEKLRKIVCIIRAGTRAAVEGFLRRSPGLAADASSKAPPPARGAPSQGREQRRSAAGLQELPPPTSLASSLSNN